MLVYGLKQGLYVFLTGSIIPLVSLIILFLIGALGGGDIKLLSVAGCFIGTDIIYIILYSFISGGIFSLMYIFKNLIFSALVRNKYKSEESIGKGRIHFSLAVLCGTLYYCLKKIGGM